MDKETDPAKLQYWLSALIAGTMFDPKEIHVSQPDPALGPTEFSELWTPRNRATLLKMQEVKVIRERVENLLSNELDEDFPSDLGREFWETLEKIALAWKDGLRAEVIQDLQSKGFSVEWFKWGHSSGFPVLVVKLKPTPEPNMVWGIADRLHELIDDRLEINTACLIHP